MFFSLNPTLMKDFNINKEIKFTDVFRTGLRVNISREKGMATINIPELIPGINLFNPTLYHYVRILFSLGIIQDEFEEGHPFKSRESIPIEPVSIINKNWCLLDPGEPPIPATDYTLALNNFTELPLYTSLVLTMGIEFGFPNSEELHPTYKGTGCLAILGIA